ncbi:protein kinase (serine/threonine-protein kinase)-like protein [Ramlibacter tataouinensis TTB310]|uniref:non-specific serine/threonine protein kinase n=2 Tax=Ramlibacter tataouinensis TaxID=94132 RepID=F5XVW4_RAMTT|nr:protein kinase (serine/threonine-protein kinase)-like protein [Ramlibacter tataouinensis TTB310]
MGIVYEGRDPNLDRRVAIKTVKVENLSEEAANEYESRFRTEARSAARLQHPNIVSVYDSDRDGDIAYLVMEYIQGDDLKHHLDRGARYTLEQSLKMIRDLLSALDYAHKQGIIHRDIKPANLLIEPAGRVKLTDFGVARIQDSGEATRTQGSMVGTLKYMAPEQVQGLKIDSRADLFSVGVVLYQLLTDKRPFDGDNDFSIIHQIIGHTPPPPSAINPRLPAAIDAVVARALAKDRDQRFATARDFAGALQSAIRRAEDATVVPPADPQRKADIGGTATRTAPSRAGAGGSAPTSVTAGSTATVTQELELVYWKEIKDSSDPDELQGFLDKFPEGIYADLARRRLRRLVPGSPDLTVLATGTPPYAADREHDPDATRLQASPPSAAALAALASAASPDLSMPTRGRSAPTLPPVPREVPAPVPGKVVASAAAAAGAAFMRGVAAGSAFLGLALGKLWRALTRLWQTLAELGSPAARMPLGVLAGAGAIVLAGIAAFVLTGRPGAQDLAASDAPPPLSQPAPAPSDAATAGPDGATAQVDAAAAAPTAAPPQPVRRAPAQAGAAPGPAATPAPPAAEQTAAAPKPAGAAARPRRPGADGTATAGAGGPSDTRNDTPGPPPAPRASSSPAPVAAARLTPPAEICKDRMFLSRQYCLQSECAKPAFYNASACVRLRDEARLREESRIRN